VVSPCPRGSWIRALAHIGAGSVGVALIACGTAGVGSTADGSATGGTGTGGAASGGAASGGAGAGGAATGGAATGGLPGSGGSGGERPVVIEPEACPGSIVPEGACRTDEHCLPNERCSAGAIILCGTCPQGGGDCSSDSQCADGFHCVPNPLDPCGCHALKGFCEAKPPSCVDGGYVCPEGKVCDPAAATDDHDCRFDCTQVVCPGVNEICDDTSTEYSGSPCVRRSCTTDADCECGPCLFNRCETQLFTCNRVPY